MLVLIFFLVFVVGVVVGGFFINTLSADHFGVSGAVRWALLGVAYAVLEYLFRTIAGSIPPILQGLVELAILVSAYMLAFMLVPAKRTPGKASPKQPLSHS